MLSVAAGRNGVHLIPPRPAIIRRPSVSSILMRDGFWLCGNPNSYMFKRMEATRSWEPHIIGAVKKHLRRGWTFIDVGAGLGFWTMFASRAVGDIGRVIAFEPNPANYGYIAMSVSRARRKNVDLYPVAISNGTFRTHLLLNMNNDGDSRVDDNGDSDTIAVPLDDILTGEPDSFMSPFRVMLKIDVQGHEPEVLRGAARLLFDYRPVVVAEEAPNNNLKRGDVAGILTDSGYTVEYLKAADGRESRDLLAVPHRR